MKSNITNWAPGTGLEAGQKILINGDSCVITAVGTVEGKS
jgi:sorbitol-specific phosphotransferase system component IIA